MNSKFRHSLPSSLVAFTIASMHWRVQTSALNVSTKLSRDRLATGVRKVVAGLSLVIPTYNCPEASCMHKFQ